MRRVERRKHVARKPFYNGMHVLGFKNGSAQRVLLIYKIVRVESYTTITDKDDWEEKNCKPFILNARNATQASQYSY